MRKHKSPSSLFQKKFQEEISRRNFKKKKLVVNQEEISRRNFKKKNLKKKTFKKAQ
jgi:hypothetical protein